MIKIYKQIEKKRIIARVKKKNLVEKKKPLIDEKVEDELVKRILLVMRTAFFLEEAEKK
jgi:hypothetical protein